MVLATLRATRARNMGQLKMKNVLAFLAVIAFVQVANAQPQWSLIGSDGKETLYVDTDRIAKVQYPMGAGGNLVGVLTPKSYKQAWITAVDPEGKTTRQLLWVFDCTGRAGELADQITETTATTTQKSYDVTSNAQSIGVERYMQQIPPNSFYEAAQKAVCRTSR